MKRRWNISLWAGFAVVLLSVASYIPVFANYPETRDVPWVNYLLFVIGGVLLALGLKRAYGQPDHYRGKISGPILTGLSLVSAGFFLLFIFYFGKQLPAAAIALKVGQPAPAFTLANADGKQTSLADLLKGQHGAVLIFYRGYWWPFCNTELRGFEKHLNQFRQQGIEVAAISVDSTAESAKLCRSQGYTYPFLSDPSAEVIRRYGVLHPKGGGDGHDIARPAEFFVDSGGIIRWENLTDDLRIRARPELVLKAILQQSGR